MIAKTSFGLEPVLANELKLLGATDIETLNRAVAFKGDNGFMYKANYCLRTALRVLKPIAHFNVKTNEDLYNEVIKINWDDYLNKDGLFVIDSVIKDSIFTHSQYVAQKAKDAIADQFRNKYGIRPSIDLEKPDLRINIHIYKENCTVSLDSSGESLHKRGYRQATNIAPISEVLAAAMILLSEWDHQSSFTDPMCGSGTLLIEAAMIANNIPAGYYRKIFGFEKWKDFDPALWETIRKSTLNKMVENEGEIVGSDISEPSIKIAKDNIHFAKLHKDIVVDVCDFKDKTPPETPGTLIMNPPYGERMEKDNLIEFYKSIGDTLKTKYNGWNAWIISSDMEAIKFIGLKPAKKITLFNGPLECRFLKFEIYTGSRKTK
jgi:putative N6-adenine-specific DNA methylase